MNDNTKICTCDTMNLEAITHLWNYRPRKFRSDAFLFWSRGPDSYRKNDRKRAVVWPWLVLQLSTVLALTQLGIRQSDWRRAGIRSTNLHIVVEYEMMHKAWSRIEEVPYCFSRSYVKLQGHTALKIVEFDPNWAFPDCNSSLKSPMATKWCTKLEVA